MCLSCNVPCPWMHLSNCRAIPCLPECQSLSSRKGLVKLPPTQKEASALGENFGRMNLTWFKDGFCNWFCKAAGQVVPSSGVLEQQPSLPSWEFSTGKNPFAFSGQRVCSCSLLADSPWGVEEVWSHPVRSGWPHPFRHPSMSLPPSILSCLPLFPFKGSVSCSFCMYKETGRFHFGFL